MTISVVNATSSERRKAPAKPISSKARSRRSASGSVFFFSSLTTSFLTSLDVSAAACIWVCRKGVRSPAASYGSLRAQHYKKKHHLIENIFTKLKCWRRIATRYGRRTHTFMSTIHIAVSVIFYLKESVLSRARNPNTADLAVRIACCQTLA